MTGANTVSEPCTGKETQNAPDRPLRGFQAAKNGISEKGRDMSKSKGLIYEPHEVVFYWQQWASRRRLDYSADTLKRPGTPDRIDPRLRGWRHVESFFFSRFDLHHLAPLWMMGQPTDELLVAFSEWYKDHPLARLLPGEDVRSICLDFIPITIAEACEELKCSRDSLQKAAKHGALFAWKPKGMVWHTNRYWLTKWKAEHPQGWAKGRPRKAA